MGLFMSYEENKLLRVPPKLKSLVFYPGNTNLRESLSTAYLLINVADFVTYVINIFNKKAGDLN
jgi:hypothetical protein